MPKPRGLVLYATTMESLRLLSPQKFKEIIMAAYEYQKTGIKPTSLTGRSEVIWPLFQQQIDNSLSSYLHRCEVNAANARKRKKKSPSPAPDHDTETTEDPADDPSAPCDAVFSEDDGEQLDDIDIMCDIAIEEQENDYRRTYGIVAVGDEYTPEVWMEDDADPYDEDHYWDGDEIFFDNDEDDEDEDDEDEEDDDDERFDANRNDSVRFAANRCESMPNININKNINQNQNINLNQNQSQNQSQNQNQNKSTPDGVTSERAAGADGLSVTAIEAEALAEAMALAEAEAGAKAKRENLISSGENGETAETAAPQYIPTLSEVRHYCAEYAVLVDPDIAYKKLCERNWTCDGKPIVSWRALLDSWHQHAAASRTEKNKRLQKEASYTEAPPSSATEYGYGSSAQTEQQSSYDIEEFYQAAIMRSYRDTP